MQLFYYFCNSASFVFFFLLSDAHQALNTGDAFYVFDHFDTFFSVIENAAHLHVTNLIRAVDILYRTAETLGTMLDAYLKQDTLDRQNDFLNLTKMVMYLLITTIRAVDAFVMQNNLTPSKTGRKNKKNTDDVLPHSISYEGKRYDTLIQICNIMQLPIDKLWHLSIIEDDFVKYGL